MSKAHHQIPPSQRQHAIFNPVARQEIHRWLLHTHGPGQHLPAAQLRTPRHKLPFPATLHLDCCSECAAANIAHGGLWINAVGQMMAVTGLVDLVDAVDAADAPVAADTPATEEGEVIGS